uniref:Rho GTPase-activating protein 19-like n=1 Tax=Saccoglossus kowalevskii TaxID=10224 RepID=A0ABM0M9Q2_SACKO|nr:PREDICTED: rho GTPase-activating protein 19-like [Saccoglossus kowalevskii]
MSEENLQKWRDKRKQDHITSLTYLFLMLPSHSYKLLQELLELLYLAAKEQTHNKMTAYNLGVMFAPHVLWPRYFTTDDVRDQNFVNKLNKGVEFMIKYSQKIFRVPPLLLAKCEAHIKNESLQHNQNELKNLQDTQDGPIISNPQSANVRVKTRHTTEDALGKLFDGVKSMEPSAKRRKLMKNFAKNCHMPGTPESVRDDAARFMREKKHSRSKSFGGVIKKHIVTPFNKKQRKNRPGSPPATTAAPRSRMILHDDTTNSPNRHYIIHFP